MDDSGDSKVESYNFKARGWRPNFSEISILLDNSISSPSISQHESTSNDSIFNFSKPKSVSRVSREIKMNFILLCFEMPFTKSCIFD